MLFPLHTFTTVQKSHLLAFIPSLYVFVLVLLYCSCLYQLLTVSVKGGAGQSECSAVTALLLMCLATCLGT